MSASGASSERPRILASAFYARPTLEVARDLLGKVLVHTTADGRLSGVIVEAEAYIGEDDPACHAAAGRTRRTEPLFGPPGRAYVYFNYGMHHLVNAVTEADGRPAAVLLRALSPLEGVATMRARRDGRAPNRARPSREHNLCRGPGNLTRALGITLGENGLDLCASRLVIEDWGFHPGAAAWSPRIGISVGTEQWWRVFVRDHPAVSGPRRWHASGSPVPRTLPWGRQDESRRKGEGPGPPRRPGGRLAR